MYKSYEIRAEAQRVEEARMSELTDIKETLARITAGDWESTDDAVCIKKERFEKDEWICQMYEDDDNEANGTKYFENGKSNADFIAGAPKYITYLLSLLEEKDKALSFYADEDNWEQGEEKYNDEGDMVGIDSYVVIDAGDIARTALNTTKEEEQ